MKELAITVRLNKKQSEQLEKLKEKWGLKTYSEVLRLLIKKMYDELIFEQEK